MSVVSKTAPAFAATAALVGGVLLQATPAQAAATPSVTYAGHVSGQGWLPSVSDGATAGTTGQAVRLEALKVSTPGATIQGHVQGTGWQSKVTTPGTVGTTGKSLRLEAIRAHSTLAGYALQCQAYVSGTGWMAWVGDGEICGTTGKSLRMEAVRLKYVATSASTNPPAPSTETRTVVNADSLNVRSGPSTSNAIVGTLSGGAKITGYAYNSTWFKITSGSYAGNYVSLSYTAPAGSGTTPPPSTGSGPAAPNSTVTPDVARQVIVARGTSKTAGTIAWYEWNGSSWTTVGTAGAVFGGRGIIPSTQRKEGDGSTPGGTFGFVDEFGVSNINTHGMAFKQLTNCTYMVSNPASANYNRFVESCNSAPSGGVHMMDYVTNARRQYTHAAWIDFNYANPDRTAPGTGSGVFLHYEPAGLTTTGCVGVTDRAKLESILKWMDASKNPKIVVKAG